MDAERCLAVAVGAAGRTGVRLRSWDWWSPATEAQGALSDISAEGRLGRSSGRCRRRYRQYAA